MDSRFLRRLKRLLAIVCPGVLTPEFGFAALVAALLVARTYCDLWMIKMSTTIESAVIRQDASQFSEYLFKFVLGFLVSAANSPAVCSALCQVHTLPWFFPRHSPLLA